MTYDQKTAKKTATYLLQINAIKLNPKSPFIWASGWQSPIYCDNRITLSYPDIRTYLSEQLAAGIEKYFGKNIVIAGVATGAIAIGMLVAQRLEVPFVYVRPEPKKHGRKNQIEGALTPNQEVVVVEDLISTGKSSINAVRALRDFGALVKGMFALFDYGFSISKSAMEEVNLPLYTLCDYAHLLDVATKKKYIEKEDIEWLQQWRENPSQWRPMKS